MGEQGWDTRRTETGGVGPRNDGVRRPNSGYQALVAPLKAQQDKVIAHPSSHLRVSHFQITPLQQGPGPQGPEKIPSECQPRNAD